jgi:putative Ca2+/H+ antiporter (TMEM165/GDT1 family)
MEKWGPAVRLIGIGFYIALCLVVGVMGGNWLDHKFRTQPIFLLGSIVVALVLIFWGVYQMLLPIISDKKERR